MVISSVRTEPPEGRRVFGVVGGQPAVIGLMHHQQLEPARAVLLVDLDAELAAGAAFPELALQLAAQAERRAGAGLADEEDRALGIADLIDAELPRQARRGLRGQRLPRFVEAQPDRHGYLPWNLAVRFSSRAFMPSCASWLCIAARTSASTSSCLMMSRNSSWRTVSAFMALSDNGALAASRSITFEASPSSCSRGTQRAISPSV